MENFHNNENIDAANVSFSGNGEEDVDISEQMYNVTDEALLTELLNTSSESEDDYDEILQIIDEESDSEEFLMLDAFQSCERQKRNSIKNYLEETVPAYTEKEFRMHFRISRDLYTSLSDRFAESESYKNLRPDKRLPPTTYLAVFLWFAGHEACSFRDLSDRFNLALSTVSRIIFKVTMFISNLSPEVIKWPNGERKQETANFFTNKCGFSGAIGCIDGTHVVIDPPGKSKDDYIDRKGHVTLTMQGICNEKKKFISIFVGFPGSSHDSWVFQNSPLHQQLSMLCGDYYLLGDSAYPCTQHLVTPYKDNGHMTRAQKKFNIKLSSGRVFIEHSFGILKQRFRQLYYCKLRGIKKLCHFIRACCVLHNIANENDLDFIDEEEEENEVPYFETPAELARGNAVRDAICRDLL